MLSFFFRKKNLVCNSIRISSHLKNCNRNLNTQYQRFNLATAVKIPQKVGKATTKKGLNSNLKDENVIFDFQFTQNFKFAHLCELYEQIESFSSRTLKIETLANFMKKLINIHYQDRDLLSKVIQLSIPSLLFEQDAGKNGSPSIKEALNFQYAFEKLIKLYLASVYKVDKTRLNKEDIVSIIQEHFIDLHSESKDRSAFILLVDDIIEARTKIVYMTGNGTEKDKVQIIQNLYSKCITKAEAVFLTKILCNKLRIGIEEKGIIYAIEKISPNADYLSKESKYFYDTLIYLKDNLFKYNFTEILMEQEFKPGHIFEVALSKPSGLFSELLSSLKKKYSEVLLETKYDGERTILHYNRKENVFKLTSRSHELQMSLYKELNECLKNELDAIEGLTNIILDGEIIIWDKETKQFGQFQDLRKKVVKDNYEHYLVAFDILYLNNNKVHALNQEQRKSLLISNFKSKATHLLIEIGKTIALNDKDSIEIIKQKYNSAKLMNCEGLIIKPLGQGTSYSFGKRHWTKLKTIEDVASDTLDLVPIGGIVGKGARNQVYGSFLMACYNKQEQKYYAVCKLGTGFSAELLEELHASLCKIEIESPLDNYEVAKIKPTSFFKPTCVWEVGFDNFTHSLSYPCMKGKISENYNVGLSLRFPRFIRVRPDKKAQDATEIQSLYNMYLSLKKGQDPIIED